MASHPSGTTYCLDAGTFSITSTIVTEPGDRVIGAGRDATFIDGTRLPETAEGIFVTNSRNAFAALDIFGAPTPEVGTGIHCDGNANCGKAFSIRGSSLSLRSVDCHDNGGNCIGGGGSNEVTVDDLDCWNNGNAYSMTPEFRFAACIKRVAAYHPGNDTTIKNSYIHDNPWVGVWCDVCKYGLFDVQNNRIEHNGSNGIQWEMSGGWTADDRAVIRNNLIRRNNYLGNSVAGGVAISTANDVVVEFNTFGRNGVAGISILFTPSRNPPQPDGRGVVVRNNAMNGDSIVGCGLDSLPKRLYLRRDRLAAWAVLALAISLAGVVVHRRLHVRVGPLIVGGGVAVIALLVVFVLPVVISSPVCINNG
jgi:hypothetical protein